MNLGHSSNVHVGDAVYHVQTEDRGADHPFIDTTVYADGRVLHRRTTSYYDLLNMEGNLHEVLRQRLEDQHHSVIEELRSGALKVAPPPAHGRKTSVVPPESAVSSAPSIESAASDTPTRSVSTEAPQSVAPPPEGISVKLLNAASWASGGRANLQIEVRATESGQPQAGVKIQVMLEGALTPTRREAQTAEAGLAEVQFALPKLGPDGGVLVIQASSDSASDQLRFQLKPKPRKPAPVP